MTFLRNSAHGQIKRPGFLSPGLNLDLKSVRFQQLRYLVSFATRLVRRDTFREPVFLCSTPLETPRMISGSAAFRAARAAFLSPEAMASSTLRIKPRTRVLRDVLMAVRFAVVPTGFLASAILGMGVLRLCVKEAHPRPCARL